jgi:DNA replication and repair protein RecF
MESFYLASLRLHQFKSYEAESFAFTGGFQLLTGRNGMGKTNLLDAIYYLGLCRSSFSLRDAELMRQGSDFFRLEGEVHHTGGTRHAITAKVQPGRQKVFEWDHKVCDTLAEHIGRVPVVLISPNDHTLISGFSEERRRLLDQTLCQVDSTYLQALLRYNRLLQQRNAWLKQVQAGKVAPQIEMLVALDVQMTDPANLIRARRQELVQYLHRHTASIYQQLAGNAETPAMRYQTLPEEASWLSIQSEAHATDVRLGRTSVGVHRDDIQLDINALPARKFASQGQVKSLVFALRLAQYQYIAQQRQLRPLLLLDDLFDKLDQNRVEALLRLLVAMEPNQVFISDTEPERVALVLDQLQAPYRIFTLEDSRILHTRDTTIPYEQTQ